MHIPVVQEDLELVEVVAVDAVLDDAEREPAGHAGGLGILENTNGKS